MINVWVTTKAGHIVHLEICPIGSFGDCGYKTPLVQNSYIKSADVCGVVEEVLPGLRSPVRVAFPYPAECVLVVSQRMRGERIAGTLQSTIFVQEETLVDLAEVVFQESK